jgi:integrase
VHACAPSITAFALRGLLRLGEAVCAVSRQAPSQGNGGGELEAFLSYLALAGQVAASTQNQAKSALLFLYKEVLQVDLPWLDNITKAKAPQRLPVVLTQSEVKCVLDQLEGARWLMASLLYGGGLRLLECLRLRVKDVDFERRELPVRDGKGAKDRVTMLPAGAVEPLRDHLRKVKAVHEQDVADGYGEVHLPYALARNIRMREKLGLAVCVSVRNAFDRPAHRRDTSPSCRRKAIAARG